jgi:hypothetical protein
MKTGQDQMAKLRKIFGNSQLKLFHQFSLNYLGYGIYLLYLLIAFLLIHYLPGVLGEQEKFPLTTEMILTF